MKKLLTFFVAIIGFSLHTFQLTAKEKPKCEIVSVHQAGKTIEVTINSSQPFYVGNNVYVLYIGKKSFTRSRQRTKDGKGIMIFFISEDDFNALEDGAFTCLTYGDIFRGREDQIEELSNMEGSRSMALGKFSKSMLK